MPSKYSEKLRNPKWQKLRLEVMQRDEFTCQHCGNSESTLNVHHLKYHGDPWETPKEFLITLCEYCHTEETNFRQEAEQKLIQELRLLKLSATEIMCLGCAFEHAKDRGYTKTHKTNNSDNIASIIYFALNHESLLDKLKIAEAELMKEFINTKI